METKQIKQLLKEKQYQSAIALFLSEYSTLINQNKMSFLKEWLRKFQTEEELTVLLKVADTSLMGQLSQLIVRNAHRRFPSHQTTLWYCEELIDQNKLIEAEEQLKLLEKEELTPEIQEKTYFLMASVLIQMQRFKAGSFYMTKCEKIAKESMLTRWGYFHLQKGEWNKALLLLNDGKTDEKDGVIAYRLLIEHHSLQGDDTKANQILEEALIHHPKFPKLLVEKIRYHYKLKQWNEMRASIEHLLDVAPYHEYQTMCRDYLADSYYQEQKFDQLQTFLTDHSRYAKESNYKHFHSFNNKARKQLNYTPIVQKYSYCVPASVEMLLSMFNLRISQDTIAESVFSVSGSKLSNAVAFIEEQGFVCHYFHGSIDRFKTLIDLHAAVIISIDYPTSAHVQVVGGYDDNLEIFSIQDPNFREAYPIRYENFEKEYGNNKALSIAIVPKEESDKLAFLNEHEHGLTKKLFTLSEAYTEKGSKHDIVFLKEHIQEGIVAAYLVKYLADAVDEDLLHEAVAVINEQFNESEYFNLIIASAFIRKKNFDLATHYLEKKPCKIYLSTYWYLKGRLHFEQDQDELAITGFKNAIKHEPDDYVFWTYLSKGYALVGNYKEALACNEVALDINDEDVFPRINHGVLLFDEQKYTEAREIFHTLLKEEKSNAYLWYERARCDSELGRPRFALRGFKTALILENDVPFSYRELSHLYELYFEDNVLAEQVLQEGLQHTDESSVLLQELGDFYERTKQFQKARDCFSRGTVKYPTDTYYWLSLASLLKEEAKFDEFFKWMNTLYERFQEDSEFLINGGTLIWETTELSNADESYYDLALSHIEKGLRNTPSNLKEALELYVGLIQDTPFYRRGIQFMEDAREKAEDEFFYISYIGCLYEQSGYFSKAKEYFHLALTIREDILPLYRLGEISYKLGENETAESFYKKVLELDPNHEQALLDLASIANRMEKGKDEKDFLLKALYMNPYCVSVEHLVNVIQDQTELRVLISYFESLDNRYEKSFILNSTSYVHGKLGNIQEEEACLNEAIALSPDQPLVLYHQVKLWMKTGKLKLAKQQLLSLIEKDTTDQELYDTLIELVLNTRSLAKLDHDLSKLKLAKPEKSIVYMNAAVAYEKTLDLLQETVEEATTKKSLFQKITNFSKFSMNMGLLLSLYETAIKLDRENITAVEWLADFYIQSTLVEDAIKVLEQSLKHHWNLMIAYKLSTLYLGESDKLSEKKQTQYLLKAKNLLEHCIEENEDPDYINLLGHVLFELGDLIHAEEAYVKSLSMEPTIDSGYFHLSRLYEAMGDYSKAEEAIKIAIEIAPQDPENYIQFGHLYQHQGKPEKALETVNKAIELDPEEPCSLYNRACYLAALGKLNESAIQLEVVFELDKDDRFIVMAEDDEDLAPLRESGYFPLKDRSKSKIK
ncbi:tetratricopeptide repeat protein [Metabacillus herbersteinensis]|uniref:Tetratricopeptide repeat protein n=1 Tax=Metabacillus herbersteinensis TaxID=283816 RepID=A0ABV6GAR3_9BACI